MSHQQFLIGRMTPVYLALVFALMGSPAVHAAKGKWAPGENVTSAVARVIGAAQAISNQSQYGFDAFCFSGSLIRAGGQTADVLPLQSGISYILIAAGDDSVQDVDIIVKNPAGQATGRHKTLRTKYGPVHFVEYAPKNSGQHKLALRLRKSRRAASFCAYSLLRTNGIKVPLQSLGIAVDKCMTGCTNIARFEGGARLHQTKAGGTQEYSGAVVAKVIAAGATDGLGGTLEKGRHAFVLATNREEKHLGFALVDANSQVVAKRIGQGAMKCLTQDKMYAVAIVNGSQNAAILAVVAVLDLPPKARGKK